MNAVRKMFMLERQVAQQNRVINHDYDEIMRLRLALHEIANETDDLFIRRRCERELKMCRHN